MSIIVKRRAAAYRLRPEEVDAIAHYMRVGADEAAEVAHAVLARPDGVDLVGWMLQDHAEKARWRCDEAEALRRQRIYQRFLDRSLQGDFICS
ncbi:MAG: hypothetical protein MUD06_05770 [Rhodospirillales bacterium]|jgi:hypothetical protein|nr:hypothetical protein [Rhodospirillales bacterium]